MKKLFIMFLFWFTTNARIEIITHRECDFVLTKLFDFCNVDNYYLPIIHYRDPRDTVMIQALDKKKSQESMFFLDEIIMNTIFNINATYERFIPYDNQKKFIIKFEDIYKNGNLNIENIKKIGQIMKIDFDTRILETFDYCIDYQCPFVQKTIGRWKTFFTKEHKQLFKKVAGQLLINMGYEKDFNW